MAFRALSSQQSFVFQVTSSHLAKSDAENFKREILNLGVNGFHLLVIVDFSSVSSLDEGVLQIFAEVAKGLSVQNQRVMVIANRNFTQILDSQGYNDVLPYYVGASPVLGGVNDKNLTEMTGSTLLNIVGPAIQENLRVYAKLTLICDSPVVRTQHNRPNTDIAGVGGFFCNHLLGNLLLCFDTKSFLKIVSAIMKREYQEVVPEISDWAAELVNSVLGKVKVDLKAQGYHFNSGIPTVFSGRELAVFYSSKLPSQSDMMRCHGEFGEFFVEAMMSKQGLQEAK
jgi:CheY-specific phosphatase CheX/anti-anti-sigma regulatory factor